MIEVRINGQDLRPILATPPSISDDMDAVCRTLEIQVQKTADLKNYLGQPIELYYKGKRWYYGLLFKRSFSHTGNVMYTAYDPLYYFTDNPDDYYFKNRTANQALRDLAYRTGVPVGRIESTGFVLPPLYYQAADPDAIAFDLIARTFRASGKKFWYRFDPSRERFGLTLFERKVPSHIWAFQIGINLESADYEESIEETVTVVKLVNRETGKVVTRSHANYLRRFGKKQHFEEVDQDEDRNMERIAQNTLRRLARVNVESSIQGINPDGTMPQFFSGDLIYVEEKYTGLVGAYYITGIKQTFHSDNLIRLAIDVTEALGVPSIQYQDATVKPENMIKGTTNGKGASDDPVVAAELERIARQQG